jgi:hypothetical protein
MCRRSFEEERRGYQSEEGETRAALRVSGEGSSRTTGTTKVWGVRLRSGRGARRVMWGESVGGCCLIRRLPFFLVWREGGARRLQVR